MEPPEKVAAVCGQAVPGAEPVFLLVRSRSGTRWTFPKGSIDPGDRTRAAAAAREALEEGGVTGSVDPAPLGHYRRRLPWRRLHEGDEETVEAWLLTVTGIRSAGEPGRRPTWFPAPGAAEALCANQDDPVYHAEVLRILALARSRLLARPV